MSAHKVAGTLGDRVSGSESLPAAAVSRQRVNGIKSIFQYPDSIYNRDS